MPVVSFPWDAQIVSIRREACPRARWDKATRVWVMTAEDAQLFLDAAHARLSLCRTRGTVTVDNVVWVLGFAQGTPYRRETPFV